MWCIWEHEFHSACVEVKGSSEELALSFYVYMGSRDGTAA